MDEGVIALICCFGVVIVGYVVAIVTADEPVTDGEGM